MRACMLYVTKLILCISFDALQFYSGMAVAAKVKRRTRSAGQYEHVKSKVPTKENLQHKPGKRERVRDDGVALSLALKLSNAFTSPFLQVVELQE